MWDTVATPCRTGVARLLPPRHSGPFQPLTMKGEPGDNLGLSRALRLLARRQEATERPTQVPRVVLRWSGSGEGTRALRGDLDSQWVRAVDGELPEQARAPQPRAPEAHEILRGELLRRRARLSRARDAESGAFGPRIHLEGGRGRGEPRSPRGVGSRQVDRRPEGIERRDRRDR